MYLKKIRKKIKKLFKDVSRKDGVQKFLCCLAFTYLNFVFLTSRVSYHGFDKAIKLCQNNQSLIFSIWHNRLLMAPYIFRHLKRKLRNRFSCIALSSKHGDGRFVGIMAELYGFKNISGSTQGNRKLDRGIDLKSMRDIIRSLRKRGSLFITPDGPRGPSQKINSQLISVSKISGSRIVSMSCSCSRYMEINSWDKMKVPLPFSKMVYYIHEVMDFEGIESVEEKNLLLESSMNLAQSKSVNLLYK